METSSQQHNDELNQVPQPIRGDFGATIMGPRNVPLERENPDLLASPYTDSGTIPNLKFSYAAARTRLVTGVWAREVTVRELPVATELAGVNMRLKPGGIRELHWHKAAELLPKLDPTVREKGYRKWKKAVARTVDWLDEDDWEMPDELGAPAPEVPQTQG